MDPPSLRLKYANEFHLVILAWAAVKKNWFDHCYLTRKTAAYLDIAGAPQGVQVLTVGLRRPLSRLTGFAIAAGGMFAVLIGRPPCSS